MLLFSFFLPVASDTHCNAKYLPGVELPSNILAQHCLKTALGGSSILVFAVPHEFMSSMLNDIHQDLDMLGPNPIAISLIKGLGEKADNHLVSQSIKSRLGLSSINVLMVRGACAQLKSFSL